MTRRHTLVVVAPLLAGGGLLVATVLRSDPGSLDRLAVQLGAALPLILVPSAAWHVLRTMAWRRCFPPGARPSFGRAFRVRLAAEAFSYVTIRGVAGEPLKVALLDREIAPAAATAAVALERIAYIVTTAAIVALGAAVALATLPLTRAWTRIFVVVMACAAALVAASLRLLLRRTSPARAQSALVRRRSAIGRFLGDVDRHLRRAIREDAGRLPGLIALEASAYVMMALEAWAAFYFIRVPITPIDALAVETLTRVASMASAFIPANLGALEASNVAAAAAVHAAGGAVALALVRRLRGLVWCAGGFLVYPRRARDAGLRRERREPEPRNGSASPVARRDAVVVLEDEHSDVRVSDLLGGMPIGERLLRAAARAGCARVLVWAPRQRRIWDAVARHAALPLEASAVSDESTWRLELAMLDPGSRIIVIAPGCVPSPRLIEAARDIRAGAREPLVEVPAGARWPRSGVFRADVEELTSPAALASRLQHQDRGAAPSGQDVAQGRALLSLDARTGDDLAEAERRLRASIFKPTDGIFGRFNRRLSIPVSIGLIRWMRLNANAMSVLLLALGFYAGWLFSRGDYLSGVVAAVVSLAASVLDGCDGELARLQYTDSAFGCWLDTLGDYAYYVSIFAGLTVGMTRRSEWFVWIGALLLAGLVLTLGLLILLRGRITSGHPERLRTAAKAHFYSKGKVWTSSVARLSMCATRATMPYGLLVFAIFNLLPAFVALAAFGVQVYWISIALQLKGLLNGTGGLVGKSSEPAY